MNLNESNHSGFFFIFEHQNQLMYLLETIPFDLFHPSNWMADQTGNVINFFAALATIIALLFAFYQNWKNKDKIDDLSGVIQNLSGVVTKLAEQTTQLIYQNHLISEQVRLQRLALRNQYRPDLKVISAQGFGQDRFNITIQNDGHFTTVTDITDSSANYSWTSVATPFQFKSGNTFLIEGQAQLPFAATESFYQLTLLFEDRLGNKYKAEINGSNRACNQAIVTDL